MTAIPPHWQGKNKATSRSCTRENQQRQGESVSGKGTFAMRITQAMLAAIALCVMTFSVPAPAAAVVLDTSDSGSSGSIIPGHYIVVLKDSINHPGAVAESQADAVDGGFGFVYGSALKGYSAILSKSDVRTLERDPRVDYIAPDRRVEVFSQTVPTGIERIYADERQDLDIDETDDVRVDVDVAVIDTGIDHTHPDLNVAGRTNCRVMGENGFECIDGVGADEHGHGTHVAGIVGALDNGIGPVGVAPGARLWGVKVLGANGEGSDSSIVAGIDWVTAHASELEVANMSLGRPGVSAVINEALKTSTEAGVVYTVAAGNANEDASTFSPPSSPDVIAVSALADYDGQPGGLTEQNCETTAPRGPDDTLARYSNWGDVVDIAAPGTCIYSTLPTGGSLLGANYDILSGTSMASPYVAGDAAILASKSNPSSRKDVETIRQQILGEGSFNWTDRPEDGIREPLLDLRPPTSEAITDPPSDLKSRSAKLNGVVSPGGLSSTYWFEYGPTTSYGSNIPASPQSAGSGVGDLEVSETISTEPDTTYHYRIAMTNGNGTFYGQDRTLKTSRWSIQDIPAPAGESSQGELFSISCASATSCLAVGKKAEQGSKPFAELWNGVAWSIVETAGLSAEAAAGFEDISCSSSTSCMAVGWQEESGPRQPLVQRWDGSKWTTLSAPSPSDAEGNVELRGVSCISVSSCMAVGNYVSAIGTANKREVKTLIEAWDGSNWTIQASPNIEGKKDNALHAVSCSSPVACTAVGQARERVALSSPGVTLAVRWDGTSWAPQVTPNPPGASNSLFEDVSCPSSSSCMAVGHGEGLGMSASWDGQEWLLRSSLLPLPLAGVSCRSAISCDAGGKELGRHWTGAEWVVQDFAIPPASQNAQIADLSCVADAPCIAVGSYYSTRAIGGGVRPLAERVATFSGFVAGGYPASISGSVVGASHQIGFPGGISYSCETGPSFSGTATAPFEALSPESTSNGACSKQAPAEKATFKTGGCDFILHPGPETSAGHFDGSFDIGPPGCGQMILDGESCDRIFAPQTGLDATFENQGSGGTASVRVNVNTSAIKYTVAGSPALCGTANTASYLGSWTVKASTGLRVTGMFEVAPTATSEAATGISASKATLHGTVNPNLLATTYQFEYGPTTAYGSKAPASPKAIGAGLDDVAVSEALSGLKPHSTYHYRVVATNAEGTTYGKDLTFATSSHHVTRFEAESYPATITSTQSPSAKHVLTFPSRPFECESANATASVGAPGAQLILAPTYSGCQATILGAKVPATIKANGCSYLLNVKNSGSPYSAKLDVSCAKEGEAIEALAFADSEKQAKGEPFCTYKIAPQSGRETISLANGGSGTGQVISAVFKLTGLAYARTQGNLTNCGSASGSATYAGTSTLAGSGGKGAVGFFVAPGEATVGLFASSGKLEAESYPVNVAAEQIPSAKHVLSFSGRAFECQSVYGDGKLSAASAQLDLEAAYLGCQATILGVKVPATITANGCGYRLNVQSGGPPFTAKLDVSCAKEGEAIEALAYADSEKQAKGEPFCTYEIAPQSNLTGISLTNFGTGSERGVTAAFNLTGLAFTRTQGTLTNCGSASGTGTYAGSSALHAFG